MNKAILAATLSLAMLAPAAAFAQSGQSGAAAGAATGAVGGAIVGGPIGAAVGGVTGAIVGGTLSQQESTRVHQYVVEQRRPSVSYQERVVVGEPLPQTVELYSVPADVGVKTQYRYSVINNRTVLVDPSTRRVVQVIE
ncbi:hypothetical protein GCM10007036_20300 [Alsobacter metallidurans]|uniref:Glycine zipper domain-containing protein n=1 Tax=Alsobacter metallidurans TaxID=340221 RepID=A0A917MHK3_9HYPH|nr:DUF1236 domain-containing protein [Alsobacter metallidurans]GGH18265.1 hypothetical protein GCM10007036_20300 [Alsobacter metallidurans]